MDGGVIDSRIGFQLNNLQDVAAQEERDFYTLINSEGFDFYPPDTDHHSVEDDDDVGNESYFVLRDSDMLCSSSRSASSAGHIQGSASLSLSASERIDGYQMMLAGWREQVGTLNMTGEDYGVGGEVAGFNTGRFGSRVRTISTSSFTGPCIAPDLVMDQEADTGEEFLMGGLPDMEDVVEQIFLEDCLQNVETDDTLVTLDESVDGETLQRQLINELTGGLTLRPSVALGSSGSQIDTDRSESIVQQQLVKKEVKMVDATPGSQNISIDGMDVKLPAGSIILAVVNESGTLVPLPLDPQSITDENTDIENFNPLVSLPNNADFCPNFPSKDRDGILPVVSQDKHAVSPPYIVPNDIAGFASSSSELLNPSNEDEFLTTSTTSNMLSSIISKVSVVDAGRDVKKENSSASHHTEESKQPTPVLEASDLATLLSQFEATENVKKIGSSSDYCASSDASVERCKELPQDIKDFNPVQNKDSLVARTGVNDREKANRQVTRVESSKPVKSLIERKKQMMLKKLAAHQLIKDALPLEIIEKIRASGKRTTTKILTEALLPRLGLRGRKKKWTKGKADLRFNKNKKINKRKWKAKELVDTAADQVAVFSGHNDTAIGTSEDKSVFQDHDYCISPVKNSKSSLTKDVPHVYNKLPDYCQSLVIKQEKVDIKIVDSKWEVKRENTVTEEASESVYSRLPDYVTDIANIKPKVETDSTDDRCNGDANSTEKPTKKKLKLSDYRMRIRSTESSRCTSPFQMDNKADIKCSSLTCNIDSSPRVSSVSDNQTTMPSAPILGTPLGIVQFGVFPRGVRSSSNIPLGVIVTTSENGQTYNHITSIPGENSIVYENDVRNIPAIGRATPHTDLSRNVVAKKVEHRRTRSRESSKKSGYSRNISSASQGKPLKDPPLIELDDEEEEQKERENKFALLNAVALSKMPTTSLGHSLLHSKKIREAQAREDRGHKVPSSSTSASSLTSSCGSISPHHCCGRKKRSNADHCGSSRSRSCSRLRRNRPNSAHSPRRNSRSTSHRKSHRSWTRCKSKSSHGRSRSSASCCSLSSSTSNYSSYSKSISGRSGSRSRQRRKNRSRRHRRYSRSREHYRSRSRSSGYDGTEHGYGNYYYMSSSRSQSSNNEPHLSTKYMSRHRSLEEIERDIEERRVIYVGSIENGIRREELRQRFTKFGPIVDVNVHFRELGDNYGFVTFLYSESAIEALEHGNDNPTQPAYNLCFGGRRTFCKEKYSDLDAKMNDGDDYFSNPRAVVDYDTLLQEALNRHR